jgi:hypothetical protein
LPTFYFNVVSRETFNILPLSGGESVLSGGLQRSYPFMVFVPMLTQPIRFCSHPDGDVRMLVFQKKFSNPDSAYWSGLSPR